MNTRVAIILVALALLAALWFAGGGDNKTHDVAAPPDTADDSTPAPTTAAPGPIRQAVESAPRHSLAPEPSLAKLSSRHPPNANMR
jgi:hypothetical protein